MTREYPVIDAAGLNIGLHDQLEDYKHRVNLGDWLYIAAEALPLHPLSDGKNQIPDFVRAYVLKIYPAGVLLCRPCKKGGEYRAFLDWYNLYTMSALVAFWDDPVPPEPGDWFHMIRRAEG